MGKRKTQRKDSAEGRKKPVAAEGTDKLRRAFPQSKIGGTTANSFSLKGQKPFAGGGSISFPYQGAGPKNLAAASKLLRKYEGKIAFWQVHRRWNVTYTSAGGKGIRRQVDGYSPIQTRYRNLDRMVAQAIADSSVNAARRQGLDVAYEGKIPRSLTPAQRGFDLIIWFHGEHRQTFLDVE